MINPLFVTTLNIWANLMTKNASPRLWRLIGSAAGVVAALLLSELLLRSFVSGATEDGSHRGPEYRQYWEGVATSHFDADYARLTGNPSIAGAPVGVILGDSHVEAIQIDDSSTMGAVAERAFRDHGEPINVRQYGWGGVAVGKYLEIGPELISKWHPVWVVVVLNRGDLGKDALEQNPRMIIAPDMTVQLVHNPNPTTSELSQEIHHALQWIAHRSSLIHAVFHRLQEMNVQQIISSTEIAPDAGGDHSNNDIPLQAPSSDRGLRLVPRASVRMLKRTFGEGLLIVYTPEIDIHSDAMPDWEELTLLNACHQEQVACRSTRDVMLQYRNNRHLLCYGFDNTVLGVGHLNASGHEVVGRTIWTALHGSPATGNRQ